MTTSERKLFINKRKVPDLKIPKFLCRPIEWDQSDVAKENINHHAKFGEYAAHLWEEQAMTDISVFVKSKEFRAHKAVLACYSPYFKEVLETPDFNGIHTLQLPTVTPRAFEILLEYMYTGKLEVNCQELSDAYRAARNLGIKGAKDQCAKYLEVNGSNIQNIVYLYVTTRKLDRPEAAENAFDLMLKNFERITLTREFLELGKDQIVEILSADEIGARSEVVIFLAALKWLHHSFMEREEHLLPVLGCIRFPLMTMKEVLACYHPPILPGIIKYSGVMQALLKATCYIAAKSEGQEILFQEFSAKPRKFLYEGYPFKLWDTKIFIPGEYDKYKLEDSAVKIQAWFRGYLTRKNVRENLQAKNYAAAIIQAAYKGYACRKKDKTSKIISEGTEAVTTSPSFFLMGACNPSLSEYGVNAIFLYSMKGNDWEKIGRGPFILKNQVRLVSSENALYIIGGNCVKNRRENGEILSLKSGFKYDFKEEKWSALLPMNEPRSLHGAVNFQKKILAIGGRTDSENPRILSSIEMLNESSDDWIKFHAPLPQPLFGMGVAVYDNKLWIAGGITEIDDETNITDSVWSYDQTSERWLNCPSLPQPLAFGTLLASGKNLFYIGGTTPSEDGSDLLSVSNIYNFKDGTWIKEHPPLPKPLHDISAGIYGENLYIFGGLSKQRSSHLEEPIYFDSEKETWKTFTLLPEEASGYIIAATPQVTKNDKSSPDKTSYQII